MALTSKFLRQSQTNSTDSTAITRYVAALKHELAEARARGDSERASQVEADLARVAAWVPEPETATAEPVAERAVQPKARRRDRG